MKQHIKKQLKPGDLFNRFQIKKKNWIANAIKHPGALHRELGVKAGHKIPAKTLASAAKKGGVEGRRARLAQTLKSFHHKRVKKEEGKKHERSESKAFEAKEDKQKRGGKRIKHKFEFNSLPQNNRDASDNAYWNGKMAEAKAQDIEDAQAEKAMRKANNAPYYPHSGYNQSSVSMARDFKSGKLKYPTSVPAKREEQQPLGDEFYRRAENDYAVQYKRIKKTTKHKRTKSKLMGAGPYPSARAYKANSQAGGKIKNKFFGLFGGGNATSRVAPKVAAVAKTPSPTAQFKSRMQDMKNMIDSI